ncbi:MAG: hypothetical protein NC122_09670 [Faecalibacterium sp.]|nr:hypothetical protein [Ruminococcus sp.]MCM1392914.1 hypothetical protein [Ruminococcus sp.]MCM1486458.1 hypothetical protein [Faecalibacterium sp.]
MKLNYSDNFNNEEDLNRKLLHLKNKVIDELSEATQNMQTDAILDIMEDIDELMLCYAYIREYDELERMMRKQKELIDICKSRNEKSLGFMYIEMSFIRLNGMLFNLENDVNEGIKYYQIAFNIAKKCFEEVRSNYTYTESQELFILWKCIECSYETSYTYEKVFRFSDSLSVNKSIINMLLLVKSYAKNNIYICNRIIDICISVFGNMFANCHISEGQSCIDIAIDICQSFDDYNEHFTALTVFLKSLYSCTLSDFNMNYKCTDDVEKTVKELSEAYTFCDRDRAILSGAVGLSLSQLAKKHFVNNSFENASEMFEKSNEKLIDSFNMLQRELNGINNIISMITTRIQFAYILNLINLGMVYFIDGNNTTANDIFIKAMDSVNKVGEKSMLTTKSVLQLKCNILKYLSIISLESENNLSCKYYSEIGINISEKICTHSNDIVFFRYSVDFYSIISEFHLKNKDKKSALFFANKALSTIDLLEKANVSSDFKDMRKIILDLKKKAKRWF